MRDINSSEISDELQLSYEIFKVQKDGYWDGNDGFRKAVTYLVKKMESGIFPFNDKNWH